MDMISDDVEVLTTRASRAVPLPHESPQSTTHGNTANNSNNNPQPLSNDADTSIQPSNAQQRLRDIKHKLSQSRSEIHKLARHERVNRNQLDDNNNHKHNNNNKTDSSNTDPSDAHHYTLHETADTQLHRYNARQSKLDNVATFGWDIYNEAHKIKTHNKRLEAMHQLKQSGDTTSNGSASPSSSTTAAVTDPLKLLQHKPSSKSVELMLKDMNAADERKSKFSRRRAFDESADQLYVNERNRQFNLKSSRAYDQYTTHIQQNLERGTAL